MAPTVVPLFSPDRVLVAGRPQRIPIGVVSPDPSLDSAVAMPNDDATIDVTVVLEGEPVDRLQVPGRVVRHDHVGEVDPDHQHANLFRYYALRTTLAQPGIYDLDIEVRDGVTGQTARAGLPIQIFDPGEAEVLLTEEPFPSVDTPTFDRPEGIDQLCTRFEPCPFHAINAADSLAAGRPLALLVATPAFCSTAYCGPVVDTLMEEAGAFPDIDIVHAEVYANTDEVDGNYQDPRIQLAPAVVALGLRFEPALFLVDRAGILVDRIDNVFDGTELAEALAALDAG